MRQTPISRSEAVLPHGVDVIGHAQLPCAAGLARSQAVLLSGSLAVAFFLMRPAREKHDKHTKNMHRGRDERKGVSSFLFSEGNKGRG